MTLHPYERGIRPGSLGHGDPAQYDYLTIKSFFANAKPADLEGLQQAYTTLQSALDDLEQRLGQHTKRLNQIWDGDAQQAGTSEIKQLAENAATLAQTSAQFGTAMSSGAAALRNPPQLPPPSGPAGALPGLIGEAAASPPDTRAAQEALAKTNTSLASAFNQIPSTLALDIPGGNVGESPYAGGASSQGTQGVLSGAGQRSGGAGGAHLSAPASSHGNAAHAPQSGLAPVHSPTPRTIGTSPGAPETLLPTPSPGDGPSSLENAQPYPGQHPEPGPGSPTPTAPANHGPIVPTMGQTPPGLGSGTPRPSPWSPTSRSTPPVPRPGDGAGRSPLSQFKGSPPASEALGGPNRISPRGVIGGNVVGGAGGQPEPPGTDSAAGGPRTGADGVLRNEGFRLNGEGAGTAMGETRQGVAAGLPMTGAAGSGGRNSERSRDVHIVENDDLWYDDSEVSPGVLGKPDQAAEDRSDGR